MVRILALAVAAIAALTTSTKATSVVNYPVGVYYKPTGSLVSGRVNNTALYHRSPCPALNSMANHGLIPRDGKNLSRKLLRQAVIDVFNIDGAEGGLADVMIGLSPDTPTFTLATLSTHNAIEHDVSLTRRDTYFGVDMAFPEPAYLIDILGYGIRDGNITLSDVAHIRASRLAECQAKNPQCDYGAQQQFIANAESGLFLRGLGGKNTEWVPYANAYSFLVNEKFPSGFTKSPSPITFEQISTTIANLGAVAV